MAYTGVTRPAVLCACGNHVFANSPGPFVILASPEDVGLFERNWYVGVSGSTLSVRRSGYSGGKTARIRLAREILGLDDPSLVPDHINCNPLDNRRGNLRPATIQNNNVNRRSLKKKHIPKGVFASREKFRAMIQRDGKQYHLGVFDTAEEAQAAYMAAAVVMHGEFARAA